MKKNKLYLRYFISIIMVLASTLFTFFGHEIWGGIIGLFILVLLSLFLSKLNLTHPLTWFTPTFFLYAISYPILVGLEEYQNRGMNEKTLMLEWVALLTFMIFIGIPKNTIKEIEGVEYLKNLKVIVNPIYIISILFCSVYMGYVYINGMNKYEIALDTSPLQLLSVFFSIYLLSFLILVGYKIVIDKSYPSKFIILNIIFGILILLFIGERDIFLKIILGIIFLTHLFHKNFSKVKIFGLGFGIFATIPIMQKFKSGFIGDRPNIEVNQPIAFEIFGGEFMSASRNLNTLLINHDSWDFFYGKTFLWDIQVAMFNGGQSTLGWFNKKFYPNLVNRGGGNGFSLVGEGYINFGIFGVIITFAFVAILLRYLYYKGTNNILWSVAYVAVIPIFIYLNRADLASLYAQAGKHILLPIGIIFTLKIILEGALNKTSKIITKS